MRPSRLLSALALIATVTLHMGCDSPDDTAPETESSATETSSEAGEWRTLFNGENTEGWRKVGGEAEYHVEDSMIVGTTKPNTGNTFLVTEETFDDFVLELETKIDSSTNSGIQIRSSTYEQDTTTSYLSGSLERRERSWPAGRLHGYQIETDPSDRAWSGGIYEEGGRGWLVPLDDNEEGRNAFRHGAWNTYRIRAAGDSITAWVNDVQTASLQDTMASSGFIGLQVHGSQGEPKHVRWRNIRIKEL